MSSPHVKFGSIRIEYNKPVYTFVYFFVNFAYGHNILIHVRLWSSSTKPRATDFTHVFIWDSQNILDPASARPAWYATFFEAPGLPR